MAFYRIICMNKAAGLAFAELVSAPLRLVNNEIYYTDIRGRAWNATYDYIRDRFLISPEIVEACFPPRMLYRIRLNTGTPARLSIDCIESLRKYKPATAEKYLVMIEKAIRKNHPAFVEV